MSLFKHLAIGILVVIGTQDLALAQPSTSSRGFDLSKRAYSREKSRWTLQEWLEQRDRNRMMDLWLAFNSPSPYEMMLGATYKSYDLEVDSPKSTAKKTSYEGELAAYAYIFGLGVEHEHNSAENYSDLAGMFNLRIFGNSMQSTHLTLHYGLKTRTQAKPNTPEENLRLGQQFAQGSLNLYLAKPFGIEGKYRWYQPTKDDTLGDVSGDLVEGGLFIDFAALRIYGNWYLEKERKTAPNTTNEVTTQRQGIKSGLRLYF